MITSCNAKAQGRARFRHGSIREPRGWRQSPLSLQLPAPLPLSGCRPRTGCPSHGSNCLQQLQTVQRARVEAWQRPAAHSSRGPGGSGHSTVPEPTVEAEGALHGACCRPPLELGGGGQRPPLKPPGWECREAGFSKGHCRYQVESKWLLGAKVQVNHGTHPTKGAKDSASWGY